MDRKDFPEWYYKEQAILKIAFWIVSTPSWAKLKSATWVPMPPSKIKSDPHYDNRLLRVLLKMQEIEKSLDIRELILTKSNREAAHNPGAVRPKVQDHIENFILNSALKNPPPEAIILFDDIITSGSHFKAAKTMIKNAFPEIPAIGLFVARNTRISSE